MSIRFYGKAASVSIVCVLILCGCSVSDPEVDQSSETTEEGELSPSPDRESTKDASRGTACELTEITDISTTEFLDIYNNDVADGHSVIDSARCTVPADRDITEWYRTNDFLVYNIFDMEGMGDQEHQIIYFGWGETESFRWGECSIEIAYYVDDRNYSPYTYDYPEKLRFDTAAEAASWYLEPGNCS